MLVALNMDYLKRVKRRVPQLYAAGVRYRRERRPERGGRVERFATIPTVLRTGWGDCEDLAAWRVAELRMGGIRAIPWIIRPHARVYHVQVRHPSGAVEDPSRKLGMGGKA